MRASQMLLEVEAFQSSRPVGVHTAAEEATTALGQMKLDSAAVADKACLISKSPSFPALQLAFSWPPSISDCTL